MFLSSETQCFYCDRTLAKTGALYNGNEAKGEHHICGRCWNQAIAAKVQRDSIQYLSREHFMARLIEHAEKEEAERIRKLKEGEAEIRRWIEEQDNKVVAVDFKKKIKK